MVHEVNLVLVRGVYDALQRGDIPALLELLHDDVELDVTGPPSVPFVGIHRGKAGLAEFFELVARTVEREPDAAVPEVHEVVVHGDKAVVTGVDRIRSKATGRMYEGWWIHVLELRDGRVARIREFFDTAAAHAAFHPAPDA
jgi:ketosteroid isomerase-like protein